MPVAEMIQAPSLAFLIPTRDRPQALALTLASVVPAAAWAGAQVLVCDQSVTPSQVPAGVRVVHRPDLSGLPAARNLLLRTSSADVVCFLDDDVDLAAQVGVQLRHLAGEEPDLLGWGPVVETRSATIRRLHRLVHLGGFRDSRRLLSGPCDRRIRALFGCCFAIRRQAALAIGFDQRRSGYALGEDLDFFRRLESAYGPKRLRFAACLHVAHRRDGHDRSGPRKRGLAKGAFLRWWASRHGQGDPATPLHLILALLAAASGQGNEAASWQGVWRGVVGSE